MKVTLDRRGDYAVRAVLDVSRHPGGLRKAREIAEEMDIPKGFLSQVLAGLVADGILAATAGPGGGYQLSRPASEITVLDVVVAAEGPLSLERCVLRGSECNSADPCGIHHVWADAQAKFAERLEATTFADLVEAGRPF